MNATASNTDRSVSEDKLYLLRLIELCGLMTSICINICIKKQTMGGLLSLELNTDRSLYIDRTTITDQP